MKAFLCALALGFTIISAPARADFDPKPLIAEFNAAGVKLTVDFSVTHGMTPAEFLAKVEAFWPVLAQNKTRFLNNKNYYREIYLTGATLYHGDANFLQLDVRMTSNEIVAYVATNSRRIMFERNLNLWFHMGPEFFPAGTGNRLGRFLQLVNTIQAKSAQLQRLTPLIRSVGFSDRNAFMPDSERVVIDENNFDVSLNAWVDGLAPMAQFVAFTKAQKLEFSMRDFNGTAFYWEFSEAGRQLLAVQNNFTGLFAGGLLKTISFSGDPVSRWDLRARKLTFSLQKMNVSNIKNYVPAFVTALKMFAGMNLDLVTETLITDQELVVSSQRLQRRLTEVQRRRYAMTVLKLGTISSWDPATKTFVVGPEATDDKFNAALSRIPPK